MAPLLFHSLCVQYSQSFSWHHEGEATILSVVKPERNGLPLKDGFRLGTSCIDSCSLTVGVPGLGSGPFFMGPASRSQFSGWRLA